MELASDRAAAASPETATPVVPVTTEVPSIIAPASWIAFGALALGLAFDTSQMFRTLSQVPAMLRTPLALVLIVVGGWCIFRASIVFHRMETPFQRWRPTRAIAANDIYARSRNPMYQGFLILVLGLALLLRSDWTVLFLMPAAMLIHYGVVMREENYLDRRFGEAYRRYKAAVPRYGWPFGQLDQIAAKP